MGDPSGNVVFVLGAPRSGTTFIVNSLVVNQPGIAGSARESMIYTWRDRDKAWKLEDVLMNPYFNSLVSPDQAHELYDHGMSPFRFWKRVIRYCTEEAGRDYFVEKSPVHTLYWKKLAEDFPEAKFIILERDPAAVIHSMVRTKWISLASDKFPGFLQRSRLLKYYSALLLYERYFRKIREAKRQYDNKHILTLNFEAVIKQDVDLKSLLEEFLKINLEEPLYNVRPFSSDPDKMGYQKDTSRIESYKEGMPRIWIKIIHQIYGKDNRSGTLFGRFIRGLFLFPFVWVKGE